MVTCLQGFFEKMGWHTSSDPRRREGDIRRNEAESYKQVRKNSSYLHHGQGYCILDEMIEMTCLYDIHKIMIVLEDVTFPFLHCY